MSSSLSGLQYSSSACLSASSSSLRNASICFTSFAYRNSESEDAQALIAGGLDNVGWDLLSDAAKGPQVWAALARKMSPQALRMNLNTLLRHDVFESGISILPVRKNTSNGTQAGSVSERSLQRVSEYPKP